MTAQSMDTAAASKRDVLPLSQTLPEWSEDARLHVRRARASSHLPALVILTDQSLNLSDEIPTVNKTDLESLVMTFNEGLRGFIVNINEIEDLKEERGEEMVDLEKRLERVICNCSRAAHRSGISHEVVMAVNSFPSIVHPKTLKSSNLPATGNQWIRSYSEEHLVESILMSFVVPADIWIFLPGLPQDGKIVLEDSIYKLLQTENNDNGRDITSCQFEDSCSLIDWLDEKDERIQASTVKKTLSLDFIRRNGPKGISNYLESLPCRETAASSSSKTIVIVNALSQSDIDVFIAGYINALMTSSNSFFCFASLAYLTSRLSLHPLQPPPLSSSPIYTKQRNNSAAIGSVTTSSSSSSSPSPMKSSSIST